jgi:hypothetical protein
MKKKQYVTLIEIVYAFSNQFVNLMTDKSPLLGNKTVMFGELYTKWIFSKRVKSR